jgi:hypothetical protein
VPIRAAQARRRAVIGCRGDTAQAISRNDLDFTSAYPELQRLQPDGAVSVDAAAEADAASATEESRRRGHQTPLGDCVHPEVDANALGGHPRPR